MLLVIDIGNTQTVLGLFDGDALAHHWRVATERHRTADEYGVLVRQLFAAATATPAAVDGAILSCVVPPMQPTMTDLCRREFGIEALIVGPGIKTGMPVLYENPREVGADRIVNAVAAYEQTQAATIAVDFGTATTFDVISDRGEYLGGAIVPGVGISTEALFARASKLPRVEIVRPEHVIGRNTVASMQSGIVFGYSELVDGMVQRISEEYGGVMRVIATGGLAPLFAGVSRRIEVFDPDLTLRGLKILYDRNPRRGRHE